MDRNEILANFQACTGIEDISECIATLEQCDWNLSEAVSVALAAASSPTPPQDVPVHIPAPSMFPSFGGSNEASGGAARMIHFDIKLNETIKHISLDETATLATLRDLAAVEFGIPQQEAKFNGWPNQSTESMPESTNLRTLNLPINVSLQIRTKVSNGASNSMFGLRDNVSIGSSSSFPVPCAAVEDSEDDLQKLRENYVIKITDKRTGRSYELTLVGSKTFQELKNDVHSLTDIPPSKQVWEGISNNPSLLTSDHTLASLNLKVPVHRCSVTSKVEATTSTSHVDLTHEEDMEIEEEFGETVESFSDELIFASDHFTPSLCPMMHDESTDEFAALTQFQAEFNSRYGAAAVTPTFCIGSLDAAIQEAFGGPARNRRLLAVYLHHDKSIQSNVFCSQLLCAPSVVEYMGTHCVTWAWDVTSDFNRKRLLDMCSRLLGSGVSNTVKRIPRDGFPMLILAQGRGRSCEVNSIIQGNTSLDELMVKLIKAVEDANSQKQEDMRMEDISEARNQIKHEQEVAYQESLQKDMEKQKKIDNERERQEEEQRERERIEREKNNKIEQLSQIIPPEPSPDCGLPITKIRFRPPCGGDMVTRTFLASEKLQGLLNYVGSIGYLSDKFRIISAWPKREISSLNPEISLKDHKLYPQDTLIIEERAE